LYDADGFVRSFQRDECDEYKRFFERYGFCVVEALNAQQCEASVDAIWQYVEQRLYLASAKDRKRSSDRAVHRSRPETWDHWPGMQGEGILGSRVVWTRQALENRANLNVCRVWATLLDCRVDELLSNHDRFGLFRPTVGKRYKRMWSTNENVHLDMNVFEYLESESSASARAMLDRLSYKAGSHFIVENNEVGTRAEGELHVQGLVNLADNREKDGGFQLVPGFHRHLAEFAERNSDLRSHFGSRRFCALPSGVAKSLRPIRITARAGYVIVWDQRVAHGSAPNHSERPRMAQFLKYFRRSSVSADRLARRSAAIECKLAELGDDYHPSDLALALFGIDRRDRGDDAND
jgi:Phytanoyl-CoA dioxygenase (PhyH)